MSGATLECVSQGYTDVNWLSGIHVKHAGEKETYCMGKRDLYCMSNTDVLRLSGMYVKHALISYKRPVVDKRDLLYEQHGRALAVRFFCRFTRTSFSRSL